MLVARASTAGGNPAQNAAQVSSKILKNRFAKFSLMRRPKTPRAEERSKHKDESSNASTGADGARSLRGAAHLRGRRQLALHLGRRGPRLLRHRTRRPLRRPPL